MAATYFYSLSDYDNETWTSSPSGSRWDHIDVAHKGVDDTDYIHELNLGTIHTIYFKTNRRNIPKSCGISAATLWVRGKKANSGDDDTKIIGRVSKSVGGNYTDGQIQPLFTSTSFTWKVCKNFTGLTGPFDFDDEFIWALQKGKSGIKGPVQADRIRVSEAHLGLDIYYDSANPSAPASIKLDGYLHPIASDEYPSSSPSLSLKYQDVSNATGNDTGYDEIKWVWWQVGTGTSANGVIGTVWNSGTIVPSIKNSVTTSNPATFVTIPWGTQELSPNTEYFFRCKSYDVNENESLWSNYFSFNRFGLDNWWDDNWTRRRIINFGTSHSTLYKGYTAELPFNTGVFKTFATNGHINEAIQHSAEDACARRGNKFWFCYRSQKDLMAYVGYYNINTGYLSTLASISGVSSFDTHYYPVLGIDSDGYIHVVIGGHNTAGKYYKSKATMSLNFPATSVNIVSNTYPRIRFDSNNNIFIFYRYLSEQSWGYILSTTSNTATFPNFKIARYLCYYPDSQAEYSGTVLYCGGVIIDKDDKCHFVINYQDGSDRHRAITYIYATQDLITYDFNVWKSLKGTIVGTISFGHTSSGLVDYNKTNKIIESPNVATGTRPHTNNGGLRILNNGTIVFSVTRMPPASQSSWWINMEAEPYVVISQPGSSWATINLYNELGYKIWKHRQAGVIQYYNGQIDYYGFIKTEDEEVFGGELGVWSTSDIGQNWTFKFLTRNSSYGIGMLGGVPSCYGNPELILSRLNQIDYYDGSLPGTSFIPAGDDIRIVYGTQEIARLTDSFWNYKDTKINFKLQATINKDNESNTKYYLYYGNYFALSTPPRSTSSIYRLFEGFEKYNLLDIPTQYGWNLVPTADSNTYIARSYGDFFGSHTNKLYDGDRVFRMNSVNSYTYYRTFPTYSNRGYNLNIAHWLEGGTEGFQLYVAYASSASQFINVKWSDTGKTIWYRTHKAPATWYRDSNTPYLTRQHHYLNLNAGTFMKIYVDGDLVGTATNINDSIFNGIPATVYIRNYLNIGRHMFIDHILIKDWVTNSPSITATPENIKDYSSSLVIANLVDIAYIRETRIVSDISGEYIRSKRLSQLVPGDKEVIDRLVNLVIGEYVSSKRIIQLIFSEKYLSDSLANILSGDKELISRVSNILLFNKELFKKIAHIISPEKTILEQIANLILVDKLFSQRIINTILTDKIETKRLIQKLNVDKSLSVKLVNDLDLNKEIINRLSLYVDLEKEVINRIVNKVIGEYISSKRIAHLIFKEKYLSVSLANILSNDKELINRVSNIILSDKEFKSRFANIILPEKSILKKIAHLIQTDKQFSKKLINTLLTDKFESQRLIQKLSVDKNLKERLINTLTLDKELSDRLTLYILLDKELITRLANTLTVEYTSSKRLAQLILGEKYKSESLANILSNDKELKNVLANLIEMDKEYVKRLSNITDLEKLVLYGLANLIQTDKTVIKRIANILFADKYESARLAQFSIMDKELSNRVVNTLLNNKELLSRISANISLDKKVQKEIANIILNDKNLIKRLTNLLIMDKEIILRFANFIIGNKEITKKISNILLGERTGKDRLNSLLSLDKEISIRFANIVISDKELINKISNKLSSDKLLVSRIVNIILGDKLKTNEIANLLLVDKENKYRLALSVFGEKEVAEKIANLFIVEDLAIGRIISYLILDKSLTSRVTNIINSDKEFLDKLTNIVNFAYSGTEKYTEYLDLEAFKENRTAELANFVANKIYSYVEKMDLEKIDVEKLSEFVTLEKLIVDTKFNQLIDMVALKLSLFVQGTDFSKDFYKKLVEMVQLQKENFDNKYVQIVDFIANEMYSFSEYIVFLANKLSRISQMVDFLIETLETKRIVELILLQKTKLDKITEQTDFDKSKYKKYVQYLLFVKEIESKFSETALFEQIDFNRVSEDSKFAKELSEIYSEYVNFIATKEDKFSETVDFLAETLAYLRLVEDVNLAKINVFDFVENINFKRKLENKYPQIIDFKKEFIKQFNENITLSKQKIDYFSETVNLLAIKFNSFSQFLSLIANKILSFSENVTLEKLITQKFSENVSLHYLAVNRISEFATFLASNTLSLSELLDFIKVTIPELILAENIELYRSYLTNIQIDEEAF